MGRPRGWRLSRSAFDDRLDALGTSRTNVAEISGVSPQQIGDMYGAKRAGASRQTAVALAMALKCSVGTLFPESDGFGPPEDQTKRRAA